MATAFKDWIPDGEETGGTGSTFRDFVPDAKPEFHPEIPAEEPKPAEPVIEEPQPVVEPAPEIKPEEGK
jgi:hypothetical protein